MGGGERERDIGAFIGSRFDRFDAQREREGDERTNGDFGGLGGLEIKKEEILLPPGIATCYPRFVNRNILYIIGVIVVIVIVLKVLGVV